MSCVEGRETHVHVLSTGFVILSAAAHHNGLSMNQALLGLSPNMAPGPKEGDLAHDMSHEAKRMHTDKGESYSIVNKKKKNSMEGPKSERRAADKSEPTRRMQ